MDNAEEVLQALDEFQKMRPSEIPRELEDYLSFVAKTGDPVYQWSLIKPLFREKLVRVMTDFYENCPTLDLASSPNIEHFNYDIMKCNLLELLESFANAPFTVQRICELLTSPRKEYNRVDKFMRAIEKNILVVSTKEPGPTARRSENGDSMINGTIEDDESMPIQQQPTNEVEMESWVKDCTTDANASVPVSPHDTPSIVPNNSTAVPIPATKISKDLMTDDDTTSIINDKNVESSLSKSSDMTVSSFIAAAHEMPNATNVTSTLPSNNINIPNDDTLSSSSSSSSCSSTPTSLISNNVQNASESVITDINDTRTTVSDVTDAIINEDTSSQPSLDSESDDNEAAGNKKLQTTFQTKDFVKMDDEDDKLNNKYYSESDSKVVESKLPSSLPSSSLMVNNETDINVDGDGRLSPVHQRDETASNSDDESKSSSESNPESVGKRPRIGCENEVATNVAASTTAVPVSTDRIDDSETNFTTVISTKSQVNTEDKSLCSDADNKLKIDNEHIIDKDENVVGNSIEKPTDNLLLQSESLFSTSQLQSQQNNQESSSESTIDSESSKDSESITESSEDSISTPELSSKPIVEEPSFDNITENSQRTIKHSESITNTIIVEALDNDIKDAAANTLIPDPIPIIEEPKDDVINTENNQAVISELSVDKFLVKQVHETEMLQTEPPQISSVSSMNIVQTMTVSKNEAGVSIAIPATSPTLTTNLAAKSDEATTETVEQMESKNIDASESMEIDSEDTLTVFQRIDDDNGDEPMEQESGESIKS